MFKLLSVLIYSYSIYKYEKSHLSLPLKNNIVDVEVLYFHHISIDLKINLHNLYPLIVTFEPIARIYCKYIQLINNNLHVPYNFTLIL